MDSLQSLVLRTRNGDADAYAEIVRRFQDMAVGYSYALLRDFQLAEDAAQEAFLEAYRQLSNLKEPAAFPSWFRRIVFKHCDRISRRRSFTTVPLDSIRNRASSTNDQAKNLEQREMRKRLWDALDSLPEHERAATMLYYISGYTQQEIGEFLDTPVTAIKKRIFAARKRLRGMLFDVFQDSLREQRPSRDRSFAENLMEILTAAKSGNLEYVKELLERDPRLLSAKDWLGNTALIMAVNSGHQEVAEMLLSSGVRPDIYEAAAIGKTELVATHGQKQPELLDSYSREGFTPLALAAHFGHRETVEFLLDHHVDIDAVSKNELGVTPLHAALYGRGREIAKLLIERSANVNTKRGGKKIPRSGWTALHYAASYGFVELIPLLIDRGADVNSKDGEGRTPFQIAVANNQLAAANLIQQQALKHSSRREKMSIHRVVKTSAIVLALFIHGSGTHAQKGITMQMKQEFLAAVKEGSETKVRELLTANSQLARVTDDKGVSAVLQAVYNGRDRIAQLLIGTGIKLNIFEASATGTTRRVGELLKNNPKLANEFSPDGFTPLGLASFFGHLDTVGLLLDRGAQINVASKNFLKAVPLRSASVAGHLEIATLLIDRGADVNALGEGGETPLHEVAGVGRIEFAKLLLDHGAKINSRGQSGKTPLKVAIENKKTEMAEYLRSRGGVE